MNSGDISNSPLRVRISAALWGFHLIWRYHPHLVIGTAVCTLVRGIAPAGFAIAIRGLINTVTDSAGDADASFDSSMLWLLVAFAITVADSLTGLALKLLSDRLKSDLTLDINTLVMQHASILDLPYIENTENREVLDRVQQDPGGKLHFLFLHSQRAALAFFQVISLSGILAWLEPAVIPFALVVAIPFFIFQWRLSKSRYVTDYSRASKRRWSSYYLSRLTNPSHAGDAKLLGIGGLLASRFTGMMREFRNQDHKLQIRQFKGGALFLTVTTIAFYALFARVILRALEGTLSIGDLAIFGGAVVRLRSALETSILYTARAYEQTLYAADISEFLKSQAIVPDNGTTRPDTMQGRLSVRNVDFTYPGTTAPTLHDISFDVEEGETIAIVGENGSGKSTLTKLLARLYDANDGEIFLDDIPVGDYPIDFLHKQVSLMGQRFGRYEASLSDNIAFGDWQRLSNDPEAVKRIAQATGMEHISESLPQGLNTTLGREFSEHDLSSGQWQLLAITRTLARSSKVLILDEPTSNIDARAEHALYSAIDELAANITTIIVSHRFSTISMADRILVMDKGRIIEQGSHDELIKAGGHYAGLYTLHEHYRLDEPRS